MQQERGREGGSGEEEDMKRNQQPQPQQQPPHKCPRCESLNTKFCYYNNYSLSQPRYFCKTCRRYWTQGGTLRNVPVGGGCRKGKRARTTPTIGASDGGNKETNLMGQPAPPIPRFSSLGMGIGMGIGSYGGGFMPSLAATQSLSHPGMADIGKEQVSNLGVLMHGLNNIVPSLASQFGPQDQQSTRAFYHPIAATTSSVVGQEESLIHPTGLLSLSTAAQGSSSSYQHLNLARNPHQGFMVSSSSSFPNVSDTSLWSISSSSSTSAIATTTTTTAVGSSSVNPIHWNDLSGYGPPPK